MIRSLTHTAFLAGALSAAVAHAQPSVEVLFETNDPAVDGSGLFAFPSGAPVLNNTGQAAYFGEAFGVVNDERDILYRSAASPAPTVQIARGASVTLDGDGVYRSFSDPLLINDAGQIAFLAGLEGTDGGFDDNSGLYVGSGASGVAVVREGDAAPDGNGVFSFLTGIEYIALNDAGQTAFITRIQGTAGGTADDTGVFLGDGSGPVVQLAREGSLLPSGNGSFSTFRDVALNDAGTAAFYASLSDTDGGFDDNVGIFASDGATLTTIAREGQPVPTGSGQFTFFGAPDINNAGQVAFEASLGFLAPGDGGSAIYLGTGGTLEQIAREGEPIGGGAETFGDLSDPALNEAGQVAFRGFIGQGSDDAIFVGDTSSVTEIVRQGDAAPDGNGRFDDLSEPFLNNDGQVAFAASLTETAGGIADNFGIFFYDPSLGLLPVIREGDTFFGHTVEDLEFTANEDLAGNEASGLGDGGRVAFSYRLAGGPDGVALWTVPLSGDLNGDLDVLLGQWNQLVSPGAGADLTGDGFVGAGDLDVLLGNWNAGSPPAVTVPEPASLAVIMLGLGWGRPKR